MYKAYFYTGSNSIGYKWFKTFAKVIEFAAPRMENNIIEVKYFNEKDVNETVQYDD